MILQIQKYKSKLTSKLQLFRKRPDLISIFFIELLWNLIEVVFAPKQVLCSVCGWTGWKFRAYADSNGIRRNALCHRCKTGSRQRALIRFLTENDSLHPDMKCLDFGAYLEYGKIFNALKCKLYFVDIVALNVDAAMDIVGLGIKNNCIDLIICYHVLEHVYNDLQALRELHRILNKNGTLILQVPWDPYRKTYRKATQSTFNPNNHVREYGYDIINKIKKTGFKVKLRNDKEGYTSREIKRYGIENAISFICCKS